MSQYLPLQAVAEQVWAKSAHKKDYTTTLGDFIEGFQTLTQINTPTGELVLTPQGFAQLARDRLGIQLAFFADKRYPTEFKVEALRYAATPFVDDEVKVRIAGNHIEAIVSNDYSFFDNADLVTALVQLQGQGLLPKDVGAMQYNLSASGRDLHLRLMAKEWDFILGENGHSQPYYGNLILSNNEIAMGSFGAQVAITRTSCTNSTIGQSFFKVSHRFANRNDFLNELGKAVRHIGEYANEMGDHLRHLQNVPVDAPLLIFDRIGEELGVPKYALNSARTYWENEGSRNSLYDIVQAVAAGAREVTEAEGRRRPSWTNRTLLERKLWSVAEELRTAVQEGHSPEEWYLQGDNALKYRILRIIEGYKEQSPVVEEILEQVEKIELS